MVRNDGYVKVLDFGLARSVTPDDGVTSSLPKMTRVDTATGVVLGTVSYMSPEQVRGRVWDTTTDIWSWGVVLYESITGNAPFQGTSVGEFDFVDNRAKPIAAIDLEEAKQYSCSLPGKGARATIPDDG